MRTSNSECFIFDSIDSIHPSDMQPSTIIFHQIFLLFLLCFPFIRNRLVFTIRISSSHSVFGVSAPTKTDLHKRWLCGNQAKHSAERRLNVFKSIGCTEKICPTSIWMPFNCCVLSRFSVFVSGSSPSKPPKIVASQLIECENIIAVSSVSFRKFGCLSQTNRKITQSFSSFVSRIPIAISISIMNGIKNNILKWLWSFNGFMQLYPFDHRRHPHGKFLDAKIETKVRHALFTRQC